MKRPAPVILRGETRLFLSILLAIILSALAAANVFAAPFAYIPHYWGNSVSVIDTSTNQVVETVSVGSNPIGVAVNPAGTRVYVANYGSKTVSVIDTSTNTVVATVNVGSKWANVPGWESWDRSSPFGVAVHPAGTRLYVTSKENDNGNWFSVIDTNTNQVVAAFDAGGGYGVAVHPEGTWVYVTGGRITISVIDTNTNTVVARPEVAMSPFGVAVNPAGTRLYVTDVDTDVVRSSRVVVIDTSTYVGVAVFNLAGHRPYALGNFIGPDPTPADTTPPTTTDNTSLAWQKDDFIVTLACTDNEGGSGCKETTYRIDGGTWQTGNSISIATEGNHLLEYYSTDKSGNQETAKSTYAKLDKTPPTARYSGNAGTYTIDQMVSITCTATDNLSGVAFTTCANISGAAYTFTLGTNSFSASATDQAGNTGTGSTSFRVQVTTAGLGNLVVQFVTKAGVANSMISKLDSAGAAAARGNANAKAGAIGAFINELQAQAGKSLTPAQAATLIALAQGL